MQTVEEEDYRSVCELVSNLPFGTVSYIFTHNNKLLAYVQVTLFPCVGFFWIFNRDRKCADITGTVPVPWAGHF